VPRRLAQICRLFALAVIWLCVAWSNACGPSPQPSAPAPTSVSEHVRPVEEQRVQPPECAKDADCGQRPNTKAMVCHHAGFCVPACVEHWGDCNHDYRDGCETAIEHRFYCAGDPRIDKEQQSAPIAGVFVTGEGVGPGKLDMAEFSVAIGPYRAALQECYARALAGAPELHGTWFYEFTVNQKGRVSDAKLVSAATRNAVLEGCVREYAEAVRVESAPRGGAVTFPCRVVFVAPRRRGE
jgi:hypothetical protein